MDWAVYLEQVVAISAGTSNSNPARLSSFLLSRNFVFQPVCLNLSPHLSRPRVVYCAPDHGKPCLGGRNGTMSRRCEVACMVGAIVVATLLLSDRVDESMASPAKANETNELQQLFLIMDEEASMPGYPSQ